MRISVCNQRAAYIRQYLRSLSAIFLRQLCLYWNNKAEFIHSLAFLAAASVTCKLTQNNLNANLLLVLFFFSLMLSLDNLITKDYQSNLLEQLWLLGINTEVILLVKVIAHSIAIACPFAGFIAIFEYVFSAAAEHTSSNLLAAAFALAINVSLVGLFSSAVCLHYSQKNIATFIAIPLIIPSMIFASLSLENSHYIKIIYALSVIKFVTLIPASNTVIALMLRYK